MPRKPKLPPLVLRIEDLSTGYAGPEFDDFDGSVLPPRVCKAPDPKSFPQARRDAANRAKVEAGKDTLIKAGRGDLIGYTPPPVEQSLAYNQRKVVLGGKELVLTVTNTIVKPFPRRI